MTGSHSGRHGLSGPLQLIKLQEWGCCLSESNMKENLSGGTPTRTAATGRAEKTGREKTDRKPEREKLLGQNSRQPKLGTSSKGQTETIYSAFK